MGLLSRLFKITGSVELKDKIQNGALLLDVRTKEEYESGHASGSVNIPLDVLTSEVERVKKGVPVVAAPG